MSLVVTALLAVLIAGSQWVSNPEDLGKRFARAQGLLATADWAGAQHGYEALLAVPDHPLLRIEPRGTAGTTPGRRCRPACASAVSGWANRGSPARSSKITKSE